MEELSVTREPLAVYSPDGHLLCTNSIAWSADAALGESETDEACQHQQNLMPANDCEACLPQHWTQLCYV